jgi:hypothetical protein
VRHPRIEEEVVKNVRHPRIEEEVVKNVKLPRIEEEVVKNVMCRDYLRIKRMAYLESFLLQNLTSLIFLY